MEKATWMREGTMYIGWEEERPDQVGSYTFEAMVKEYTGEARNWNQQENSSAQDVQWTN